MAIPWAAVGSASGGAISSGFNFWANERTNSQNKALFYADLEWKERMARHAHRYEVEDLKAAGLNPILSAGGSASMSAPGTSVPHMQATQMSPIDIATTAKTWQDKKLSKALANSELSKQELNKAQTELVELNKLLVKSNLASARNVEWFEKSKAGPIATAFRKWKEALSPFSAAGAALGNK